MVVRQVVDGVTQQRRCSTRSSASERVPPLLEQQELLKTIVTDAVRTAGYGWDRLELLVLSLGGYIELDLIASYPGGSIRRFNCRWGRERPCSGCAG